MARYTTLPTFNFGESHSFLTRQRDKTFPALSCGESVIYGWLLGLHLSYRLLRGVKVQGRHFSTFSISFIARCQENIFPNCSLYVGYYSLNSGNSLSMITSFI